MESGAELELGATPEAGAELELGIAAVNVGAGDSLTAQAATRPADSNARSPNPVCWWHRLNRTPPAIGRYVDSAALLQSDSNRAPATTRLVEGHHRKRSALASNLHHARQAISYRAIDGLQSALRQTFKVHCSTHVRGCAHAEDPLCGSAAGRPHPALAP